MASHQPSAFRPEPNKLSLVVATLVVLAFLAFNYFSADKKAIPLSGNNNIITIFPFEIKGSSELQYLSEGIVDLISTKLDDIPELAAVDPNLIANELKTTSEKIPGLVDAKNMSEGFGASRFILGGLVAINDQLTITASKYDLDEKLLSKKTVEGKMDQLASLIDELTRSVIADEFDQRGNEMSNLAAMTSNNFPALCAYLKGEQAFRKSNVIQAYDHYTEAVKLDSTFAIAWMRLERVIGWSPFLKWVKTGDKIERYKSKLLL
jgi:serine/threonine-protein kinase